MNLAFNKIAIDQVWSHSLQITLGIYLNLYILFEKFACDDDLRIMDLYVCNAKNGFGENEENKNPFHAEEPIYNLILSYLTAKLNWLLVTDKSSDVTGNVHQLNVVETEINGAESVLSPWPNILAEVFPCEKLPLAGI